MKLLLASNGDFLVKEGYQFLGIPKNKLHIGYVITASKGKISSTQYLERHQSLMRDNGYSFEVIDIEGKDKEELERCFADKNVIHIEGGDTFYLLNAVKASGFGDVIKKLLKQGVVYVGTSAGSSIAGPTIELSSHVPEGVKDDDLVALKLVPFLFKAHYTDDKRDIYQKLIKDLKYPAKFLRDGQGILVEDGQCRLVGGGEEVKL